MFRNRFITIIKKQVRLYHKNVIDHYENPRNVGSLDSFQKICWNSISWGSCVR